MTVTYGCLSRSVRDTARWFDVCNGRDPREPLSLPRVEGWEAGLGTHLDELRGKRVAVVPDWGAAVVSPVMWELLEEAADQLDRRHSAWSASTGSTPSCRGWAPPGRSPTRSG